MGLRSRPFSWKTLVHTNGHLKDLLPRLCVKTLRMDILTSLRINLASILETGITTMGVPICEARAPASILMATTKAAA